MTSIDLHHFADIGVRRRREASCTSALTPSRLPGLEHALNPYRGCAHGCVYCYAPALTHIPWEQWTDALPKRGLLRLLAKELRSAEGVIGVGTATDPYQPLEASTGLTRNCLELISRSRASACVHTKSDLVLRDLDLLRSMEAGVTVTTLDDTVSRALEPGAPMPRRRLRALQGLVSSGVDAFAMVGPALSCLEGRERELMEAIAATGVPTVMVDPLNLRPDRRSELNGLDLRPASDAVIAVLKREASTLGMECRDAF